jgi:hypothetical protein
VRALARWAWVIVLGTALALSWWSLDALARHYGVPTVLAGMVSATFDGAALVAAELAIRRAQVADSAAAVKLLMLAAVALSAWLNYEHGALLSYPLAVRVLFAAPPVIAGALFEVQLRTLHRAKLHDLGLIAQPLPRLGLLVWLLHPFSAYTRVRQISASRLQSVPLSVMDWQDESAPRLETQAVQLHSIQAAAPDLPVATPHQVCEVPPLAAGTAAPPTPRLGDDYYAARLGELVAANSGKVPSAREVARKLSIGQDRARRLVAQLAAS